MRRRRIRSLHGAERNAGAVVQSSEADPDFALLHPGYDDVYAHD
jgi:hypothetical protein